MKKGEIPLLDSEQISRLAQKAFPHCALMARMRHALQQSYKDLMQTTHTPTDEQIIEGAKNILHDLH